MVQAVWIGLGVAVWLTLAAVTALLVGRVVGRRDAQVPAGAGSAIHRRSAAPVQPDVDDLSPGFRPGVVKVSGKPDARR
jgi:hypothetical protein